MAEMKPLDNWRSTLNRCWAKVRQVLDEMYRDPNNLKRMQTKGRNGKPNKPWER